MVLAVVFLAGEGSQGNVTVPPIAGGLSQEPAQVVVQSDSGGSVVPVETAYSTVTPPSSDKKAPADRGVGLETVPPIVASLPVTSPAAEDTVVVAIGLSEPTFAGPPEQQRWAKTWVNVRSGRSGNAAAVRVLNPGEPVGVDSLGRGWYRVSIGGVPVGYVDRSFLASAPPDSIPG